MNFIWLDLETTGLDPRGPNAEILELGLVAVSPRLEVVGHWHSAIRPSPAALAHVQQDARLLRMHSDSGLWGVLLQDAQTMRNTEHGGLPILSAAVAVALQFVQHFAPGATSPLCGANPSFDRSWLRALAPALADAFHYRHYDTNFCFLSEHWLAGTPSVKGEVRHRALADCMQSINTVRRFYGLTEVQL